MDHARLTSERPAAGEAIGLLAAGASSRMRGRDKLLEIVDGMPLLRRQALAALASGARVLVALPPDGPDGSGQAARRAALDGLGGEQVTVPDAALGMGHSIAALARAAQGATGLMVLNADLPGIGAGEIGAVLAAFRDDPDRIWRGASAGKPGHPVIFPHRFLAELMALTGDHGARGIVARGGAALVELPGDAAIRDLDTPGDWARWRASQ